MSGFHKLYAKYSFASARESMETPVNPSIFLRGWRTSRLGKEFVDRIAERQDGMRTPPVVEVLLGDVDAEVAIHGGKHVLRTHGAFLGFGTLGIGSSHDTTALDTAS